MGSFSRVHQPQPLQPHCLACEFQLVCTSLKCEFPTGWNIRRMQGDCRRWGSIFLRLNLEYRNKMEGYFSLKKFAVSFISLSSHENRKWLWDSQSAFKQPIRESILIFVASEWWGFNDSEIFTFVLKGSWCIQFAVKLALYLKFDLGDVSCGMQVDVLRAGGGLRWQDCLLRHFGFISCDVFRKWIRSNNILNKNYSIHIIGPYPVQAELFAIQHQGCVPLDMWMREVKEKWNFFVQ